jgi:hypothetical protein
VAERRARSLLRAAAELRAQPVVRPAQAVVLLARQVARPAQMAAPQARLVPKRVRVAVLLARQVARQVRMVVSRARPVVKQVQMVVPQARPAAKPVQVAELRDPPVVRQAQMAAAHPVVPTVPRVVQPAQRVAGRMAHPARKRIRRALLVERLVERQAAVAQPAARTEVLPRAAAQRSIPRSRLEA